MNKKCIWAAFLGGMVLALFLGACENSTGGDDLSAQQVAAAEYRIVWDHVLTKNAERAALKDEADVDEALEEWAALDGGTQAELAAEKTMLDSLRAKITALQSSAAAWRAWLEEKPDNTIYTPYTVSYTGQETPAAIFKALTGGGKYVNLDLSRSSVAGFAPDVEPGRALVVHLVLPDSLEEIEDGASAISVFNGFASLRSVSASGLRRLGKYGFYNCAGLETVTLDAAASIGDHAFNGCANLATVNLPKAASLGDYVFQNCAGLAAISLPEAASLGWHAFDGCAGLATVNLPKAASLGPYTFQNCAGLTTVILGETPPTLVPSHQSAAYPDLPPYPRNFASAATTAKTITIKAPDISVYIDAGTPWSDKMGLNSSVGDYWDNNLTTKGNLTVALAAIDG
jgi:hypothetical protein